MNNQPNPLLVVKPIFRSGQTLIISLIISIFITMFFGSFLIPTLGIAFGAIIIATVPLVKDSLSRATESAAPYSYDVLFSLLPILLGLIFYLIITLIVYKVLKRSNGNTVYTFYENHFTFTETYRKKVKMRISYSSISKINCSCSTFQERLGVGTVSITTSTLKTINLSNIHNPEEIYQKISTLTGTQCA